MKVIHAASELKSERVCLAIGVFDGVHLGHQQVIRQTVADATQHECLPVVATFDRHPNEIVAPDRVPPLIYRLPQKLRAINSLGVKAVWLIRFDEGFSRQTGEEFVRALVRDLGPIQSVCVGGRFTFGAKRSGNVALLQNMGRESGFLVHGLASVSLDGEVVSSTRIRESIRSGQLDSASQMLGRSYALRGKVLAGDKVGRQLGFPTANVDVAGLVLPPVGVYAAHVDALGRTHRAVFNIGFRPTLRHPVPQLTIETHLLEFNGDLYDQEIEITVGEKLREEQKFPSLEALKAQIAGDIAEARRHFGSAS